MEHNTWPPGSGGHAFSTISASSSSAPSSSPSSSSSSSSSSSASRWREAMEVDWQQQISTTSNCTNNSYNTRDNPLLSTDFVKTRASTRGRKDRKFHSSSSSSSGYGETRVRSEEHGVNFSRHIRSLLSSPHTSQSRNSHLKHSTVCPNPSGYGPSSSSSYSHENPNLHEVSCSTNPNPTFGSSSSHQALFPTSSSTDFGSSSSHQALLPANPNIGSSASHQVLLQKSPKFGSSSSHEMLLTTSRNPNFGVSHQVLLPKNPVFGPTSLHCVETSPPANPNFGVNFALLPDDILLRISGAFSWPHLWAATMVCRSWSIALAPLREAMLFVHWGKKFKHGRAGVSRNLDKALDSFLKGATRGCAAAMVDAGLLLWETGKRQDGVYWYKKAAELGDSAGQCNLGLAYLQDPANPTEAVMWFRRAAFAGHVRAQYSLALCLQQGRGVECSSIKAARWYQRAAEGGSARAMYNLAICYRKGEGINGDLREARKWMKRAALSGHRKAQFEHGLTLFAESDGGLALVFLELATRAGETAATHLRDALLQQLSPKMRTYAISCADKWQAKLNTRV